MDLTNTAYRAFESVSHGAPVDLTGFHNRPAFPGGTQAVLTIVIDTEEEFDWSKPFARENTGVQSVPEQDRAQEIFACFGVVPTYVIDYCIASDPAASAYFRGLADAGACDVGTHLHPWVNPPHEEEVNNFNSYHGNLPADLEYRKLQALTDTIADALGRRPTVFKAGRYGVGKDTFAMIKAEGYQVDCSVVPSTDFSRADGPNYLGWPKTPFWIDPEKTLLEAPLTRGFSGQLAAQPGILETSFDKAWMEKTRFRGILAKTGLLERAGLTPEGVTAAEQIRLLQAMYDRGVRHFQMTYHSPSLGVGFTPYVRSEDDRLAFLTCIREVLTYFRDRLGGTFTTVQQLYFDAQQQQSEVNE